MVVEILNNIIDTFDPCLRILSVYALYPLLFFILFFSVWSVFSGFMVVTNFVSNNLFLLKKTGPDIKASVYGFIRPLIFLILVSFNFLGFSPYIFSVTRQPLFTFFFSLIFVLPVFINIFLFNNRSTAEHLTPKNCPFSLIFFLVLIEFVSLLIRPITLILRLAANTIAGHVIRGLVRGFITKISFANFFMFIAQFFIVVLERGVCLIQGYVFGLLFLLYFMESI